MHSSTLNFSTLFYRSDLNIRAARIQHPDTAKEKTAEGEGWLTFFPQLLQALLLELSGVLRGELGCDYGLSPFPCLWIDKMTVLKWHSMWHSRERTGGGNSTGAAGILNSNLLPFQELATEKAGRCQCQERCRGMKCEMPCCWEVTPSRNLSLFKSTADENLPKTLLHTYQVSLKIFKIF